MPRKPDEMSEAQWESIQEQISVLKQMEIDLCIADTRLKRKIEDLKNITNREMEEIRDRAMERCWELGVKYKRLSEAEES